MSTLTGRTGGSFEPKGAVGATVASATTITIPAFGNYFPLTGTTNITGMVVKAGREFILQTSGALTLSDSGNIDLGGKDFITSPGDTLKFYAHADNTVRMLSHKREGGLDAADMPSGSIVQVVNVEDAAVATGSTAIPYDDTIPQNTEGDQYMSLAITPTNASNILEITAVLVLSSNTAGRMVAALFRDSAAGAIAVATHSQSGTAAPINLVLRHRLVAGSVAATTFKIRAGAAAGTNTFNGDAAARKYGGVALSDLTIKEIAA